MGICLNMIVKNETKNLERLFASLYKYIDYFVIADTGSDDDTIDMIRQLGKMYNIPGKVVEHQWVDFSHNRQLVLEEAVMAIKKGEHHCKWLLIIDADEELITIDRNWKNKLDDGYSYTTYKKLKDLTYKRIFLPWIDGIDWKWKGKVHEYLSANKGLTEKRHLSEIYIRAHQYEGSYSRKFQNSREKGLFEINLLLAELATEQIQEDNMHRFMQLAFIYLDINEYDNAVDLFGKIAHAGIKSSGYHYIALLFAAKYLILQNKDTEKAQAYLQEALVQDAGRKEAYYYAAILERKKGNPAKARNLLERAIVLPESQSAPVLQEEEIAIWKTGYELAFVLFQLKEYNQSFDIINELIAGNQVPDVESKFLLSLKDKIQKGFLEKN